MTVVASFSSSLFLAEGILSGVLYLVSVTVLLTSSFKSVWASVLAQLGGYDLLFEGFIAS